MDRSNQPSLFEAWFSSDRDTRVTVILTSGPHLTGRCVRHDWPGLLIIRDDDGHEALVREADVAAIGHPAHADLAMPDDEPPWHRDEYEDD